MAALATILSRSFDQIEYGDLERLIAAGAAEDEHIDFKGGLYEKREDLAADVVAMANTTGGSIVIGMTEREGVAAEVAPVLLSDASALKMRQWIGSYTTPHVDVRMRAIASPDASDRGAYLIDVSLSSR